MEVLVDQYPLIHGPYAKPPRPQCLECYKLLEEEKGDDVADADENKSRYRKNYVNGYRYSDVCIHRIMIKIQFQILPLYKM